MQTQYQLCHHCPLIFHPVNPTWYFQRLHHPYLLPRWCYILVPWPPFLFFSFVVVGQAIPSLRMYTFQEKQRKSIISLFSLVVWTFCPHFGIDDRDLMWVQSDADRKVIFWSSELVVSRVTALVTGLRHARYIVIAQKHLLNC